MAAWNHFIMVLGYLYLVSLAYTGSLVLRFLIETWRSRRIIDRAAAAHAEGAATRASEVEELEALYRWEQESASRRAAKL